MSAIGSRIAAARKKMGLNASEFARRVQVTPTAVWNWEKNGITPRGPVISTIAGVLGVTEDFLKLGTGSSSDVVLKPLHLTTAETSGQAKVGTVAEAIERAKREIAGAAGLSLDRVRLSVEFL